MKTLFKTMLLVTIITTLFTSMAYAKEINATVTSVNGDEITTRGEDNETYIFYKDDEDKKPFKIGESMTLDICTKVHGTITNINNNLVSVNIDGEIMNFYIDGDINYKMGEPITLGINEDWEILEIF